MHPEILTALRTLESDSGIRVLYACESGSRAWGFASPDSDWDARFFFAHPQREYLRVHEPRDHIHRDLPGDLDITGWDLRKALHHLAKSSASVLEWLHSPLVYLDGGDPIAEMRRLARECFRVKPTVHHYLGLAKQLWHQAGAGDALNGKKVLYVLRATLCARWALTHGTPPPVAFAELLPLVTDTSLRAEIEHFVTLKQQALESDTLPVSETLRHYLATTREACEAEQASLTTEPVDMEPLDDYFFRALVPNS